MTSLNVYADGVGFSLTVGDTVVVFHSGSRYYSSSVPRQRLKGVVTRIMGSDKAPYFEVSIEGHKALIKFDRWGQERGVSRGWVLNKFDTAQEEKLEQQRQEAIVKDKLDTELHQALADFNTKGRSVYVNKCPDKVRALIELLKDIATKVG